MNRKGGLSYWWSRRNKRKGLGLQKDEELKEMKVALRRSPYKDSTIIQRAKLRGNLVLNLNLIL